METTGSGKRPGVLIIDDSTENLRLLTEILLEEGIEPQPISDSRYAIAVAKANTPDLVLLDIDMPGLDGFEVCRAFKDDDALKKIPIIFVSGIGDSASVVKGLALGGVDYVTKPFRAEEISARIHTHLRIVSLQRQLSQENQALERQVSERTRELANANQRLVELTKLKGDLLHMIAHELRTPTNGLLGFADLAFEMCPPSAQVEEYRAHYHGSRQRLLNLISDAKLISDLTENPPGTRKLTPLLSVFDDLRRQMPKIDLELDGADSLGVVLVYDEHGLLLRALETAVSLAEAFSSEKGKTRFTLCSSPNFITMRASLDALRLPSSSLPSFFQFENPARYSSAAEPLSLAPVVARRILCALGGDLRLSKQEGEAGEAGTLEVAIAVGGPQKSTVALFASGGEVLRVNAQVATDPVIAKSAAASSSGDVAG